MQFQVHILKYLKNMYLFYFFKPVFNVKISFSTKPNWTCETFSIKYAAEQNYTEKNIKSTYLFLVISF